MGDKFSEAVQKFSVFLKNNGFPPRIVWLTHADILLAGNEAVYVRNPDENIAEKKARKAFEEGAIRGNGVLLKGLFAGDDATYAHVWFPNSWEEAEYGLMPANDVKLAINTSQAFKIVTVRNNEEWVSLANRYSAQQSQKMLFFE